MAIKITLQLGLAAILGFGMIDTIPEPAVAEPQLVAQSLFASQTVEDSLNADSQTLEQGQYVNTYTITGTAGQKVTVELTTSDFSPVVIILDDQNQVIASNTGNNTLTTSFTLPRDGTYTIGVTTLKVGEQGSYTLSWRTATDNESELAKAQQLNQQAIALYNQGRYTEAVPLAEQALEIRRRVVATDHPDVADSLNNLAELYRAQGRYIEAEPLFTEALAMRQRLYDGDYATVADSLSNIAELYRAQGRYNDAESLQTQALAMRQRLFDDHMDVVISLNNLALVYGEQKKYSQAEPLYTEALAMSRRLFDGDHPIIATNLNNLAFLYDLQERYSEAEPLYTEALAIRQRLYKGDHPNVANSLNNLASLYVAQGKYSEAEPLYTEALAMQKRLFPDEHPAVSNALNNLASLYWSLDEYNLTLTYLSQGMAIEEKLLQRNLGGSEAQKRAYLDTLGNTQNWVISLHLQDQSENLDAARLAFTTILQRKGRILDSSANVLPALRDRLNPQDQQLLDELETVRSGLSSLVYQDEVASPGQYQQQIETLSNRAEDLEAQLARRSQAFKTQTDTVSIETVQQQIPPDSVLVEFVQYLPFEPKEIEYGQPRYAAYILTASGQPSWIDLGEAAAIDAGIEKLRRALQDYYSDPEYIKQVARELDSLLMQPVRKLISSQTHLLLAPDSQLNLIPFEALVDQNNQYLIENYAITYLTSGSDLLRLDSSIPAQQPPVVVANPQYSVSPDLFASNQPVNSSRSVDLAQLECCAPLAGTEQEASAILPLLPNNTIVLTEAEADEASIKQVNAPSILHIATHGFFLPDLETETVAAAAQSALTTENPLLRSGLAFAGFNPSQGQYEGVLTALEMASMNLWGTELVVLSACETGVGDVRNGEGVYGLRRSLVLAGSESQLISLWDVDDLGTKDLMKGYYQKLTAGVGRGEALRQTQLEMLQSQEYAHPYYWAAFIVSGNWQPIDDLPSTTQEQNQTQPDLW